MSLTKTDFDCPSCGHNHGLDYYEMKWFNHSTNGYINIKCEKCKVKLELLRPETGTVVYLKSDTPKRKNKKS